jgi:hypothetical protein
MLASQLLYQLRSCVFCCTMSTRFAKTFLTRPWNLGKKTNCGTNTHEHKRPRTHGARHRRAHARAGTTRIDGSSTKHAHKPPQSGCSSS